MGLVAEAKDTLEGSGLLDVQQIDCVAFYKMTEAQISLQAFNDEASRLYIEACTRR